MTSVLYDARRSNYETLNDDNANQAAPNAANSSVHTSAVHVEQHTEHFVKHCHSIPDIKEKDVRSERRLILATILCSIFMVGELVGGIMAHSLAIITDSAHMFTDLASFLLALLALRLSTRQPTRSFSFGWYRAEIVGALISVFSIWVVTGILVYLSIDRIVRDHYEVHGSIMAVTAGTAVIFNVIMGLMLHQSHGHLHTHGGHNHSHNHHDHSHDHHDHSHEHHHHSHDQKQAILPAQESRSYTESLNKSLVTDGHSSSASKKVHNPHAAVNVNVRAAFIHVLGDLVQSIGVLIAAIIIYFKPDWRIADPICTLIFSVIVAATTLSILRDIMLVLMEAVPRHIDFNEVRMAIGEIQGVLDVHDLRIWSLTMNRIAMTVHVVVDARVPVDKQETLRKITNMVKPSYHVSDLTVQIEEQSDDMQTCDACRQPLL